MADPATISTVTGPSGLLTPLAILGASAINATVAWKNTSRNIEAQKERDERLNELQERHRLEDKRFQIARDQENERFQLEMEANRMNFQEHMELRRLQCQVKMEEQREKFQAALQTQQIKSNLELAQFQVMAMRETQILTSRENARNTLENQMVLEALKTFPLNISPIVLLNSRPHSLSSLLRFTVDDEENDNEVKLIGAKPIDVIQDVLNYAEHPEALNIFIAPVFVDSKMSYQKNLSTKIWEATYQKIESFFTKHYSRDSKRPVVFYPTAWNDKYTSGVHASETLHFFLKDIPCIVLEPKFDGNKFRMAISSWGLGYGATNHHRTECDFDVNIDIAMAQAIYERSKNAVELIDSISSVPNNVEGENKNKILRFKYARNIQTYDALKVGDYLSMDESAREKLSSQLSALGLDNVFSLASSQDLEPIADYFASQIGTTLAMLSDVHHLIATSAEPKMPELIRSEISFKEIFANKVFCEEMFKSYRAVIALIRDVECSMSDSKEAGIIYESRNAEIRAIQEQLDIKNDILMESWEIIIRKYVKEHFQYENEDFEVVWSKFIYNTDKYNLLKFLPLIKDKEKKEQLTEHIDNL